ncbi:site-specific DNA-methyltransferase [Teredinibacter waterburyi]|uniref:site-specific DNA-methyltransferase n=1 Tax=Teredinibacter waterburyi TaxID=1500538 RepID=UPI00165F24AF|nr:site-specific DNA-methyltransferase [Teredinibacter waterburyi]
MKNIELEDGQSADIVSDNISKMKELFPDAFSEGGVNFDTLRQLLGDASVLDEGEEKYGLNWHGKKKARQIALTPSTGTLLPCPEESVDWDTTKNLFIEGDNLEVLKLLQKSFANKVKMIFIDPPYNTGEEFIYPDKFSDNLKTYLRYSGQVDDDGLKFSSQTEVIGRKHTNWLSMMYPRLKLAKNLMTQDGVIFICIDDNEVANLRAISDEIFGEENFIAGFIWEKRTNRENRKIVSSRHDYILCYCKNLNKKEDAIKQLPMSEEALNRYKNPDNDPRGEWKSDPATAQAGHATPSQFYVLTAPNGKQHELQSGRCWLYTKDVMEEAIQDGRIWFGKDGNGVPRVKTYLNAKERGLTPESIWFAAEASTNESAKTKLKALFSGKAVFETPKPVELIDLAIKIGADDGVVLDFFAGSCATAEAALKSGNRFIVVQLPEACDKGSEAYKSGYTTIADIGKDRLRKVAGAVVSDDGCDLGFKVFKLSYSNINLWNPDRTDLEESLLSHEEHLVENRTEQDVLYELLLKRGVDLAVPIESREVSGKNIYSIGYGVLFACLDESITKDQVEDIAQAIITWHGELAPSSDTHVFFRDSAFRDDVSKTNMAAILVQNGITHVRSL